MPIKTLRVVQVNHSDSSGGAARAAYRLHRALLNSGIDSKMVVDQKGTDDWTVYGPIGKWAKLFRWIRPRIGSLINSLGGSPNKTTRSYSFLPSSHRSKLNSNDSDIIHLHWVQGEMLSITDIGSINKPLVWTLHDMWAFSGAEHVTEDKRWSTENSYNDRVEGETGLNLNKWVWHRKRTSWKKPIQIVTPSKWLASCVINSVLMKDWPIEVIPNPIDTDFWKPMSKDIARELLNLPKNKKMILFGAMGGGVDPNKGYDLLTRAIDYLGTDAEAYELMIMGQAEPQVSSQKTLKTHFLGHLSDDLSIKIAYNAADVFVLPSRVENFPNSGVEAHSCGIPVVGFRTCGLPDVVLHEETGYLASAFDPEHLAKGILWVLDDDSRHKTLSEKARDRAVRLWDSKVVAESYLMLYKSLLSLGAPNVVKSGVSV